MLMSNRLQFVYKLITYPYGCLECKKTHLIKLLNPIHHRLVTQLDAS